MLWKDLLWRVLTGISTFLLNLCRISLAHWILGVWRSEPTARNFVTPENQFIIWFYCFEADLVGKYEASEQICLVAPTTLYISVPLSIPETFARTELLDVVIAFYRVILTWFRDFLISGGIPQFSGTNSPPEILRHNIRTMPGVSLRRHGLSVQWVCMTWSV